jgi:hypothetical protein
MRLSSDNSELSIDRGADQKVVNFEQISIRKRAHVPLDRGDVFLEVQRQFDRNIRGDRS